MKLKRRDMLFSGAIVAMPLTAQTTQAAQTTDPLEQARAAMKTNRSALDKIKLPMAVEPAFVFKV